MNPLSTLAPIVHLNDIESGKLYRNLIANYSTTPRTDFLARTCSSIWKKLHDPEVLARAILLTSILDPSHRLRPSKSESDLHRILYKLLCEDERAIELGTETESIDPKLLKPLKKNCGALIRTWRGQGGTHGGGARVEKWVEELDEYLASLNYRLLRWLEKFPCPLDASKHLENDLLNSRRASSKFIAWVSHPKVLPHNVPRLVKSWYPRHRRCYSPRIDEEVLKFLFRTGAITIRGSEKYHPRPERGFVDFDEFYVPEVSMFYAPAVDHIRQYSKDPAMVAETAARFGESALTGICTDEDPKCKRCRLNSLCRLSLTHGGNPTVVRSAPKHNKIFINPSPKSKTRFKCYAK